LSKLFEQVSKVIWQEIALPFYQLLGGKCIRCCVR